MKRFPENLKTWMDAVHTVALIVATLIVVIPGVIEGLDYLSAKSEEATAVAAETRARTENADRLTNAWIQQLERADEDIRALDAQIERDRTTNSAVPEATWNLRMQKSEERQDILNRMGEQMLEFQRDGARRPNRPRPGSG